MISVITVNFNAGPILIDCVRSVLASTVPVEVFVVDPDAFVGRAVEAGADGSIDPVRDHEVPWGIHRQGGFRDPFGHVWLVGDTSPLAPQRPAAMSDE